MPQRWRPWRNLGQSERAALIDAIAKLARSAGWSEALKRRGWTDTYLDGAAFGDFLKTVTARIAEALKDAGVIQ